MVDYFAKFAISNSLLDDVNNHLVLSDLDQTAKQVISRNSALLACVGGAVERLLCGFPTCPPAQVQLVAPTSVGNLV